MTTAAPKAAGSHRLLWCALALVSLVLYTSHLAAWDVWWHLTAGEQIVRTFSVPRTDPFSYTAGGQPWVYHSWLGGVVMFAAHKMAGEAGLVLLRTALMSTGVILVCVAARRRGTSMGLACLLCLAVAWQLRTRALTRPYLFSFVLFMVFYLVLQRTRRHDPSRAPTHARFGAKQWFLWGGGGRLLALPCLMVLWANLHGGFLVGMLAIGAFGAGEMLGLAHARRRPPYWRALLGGVEGSRFRALFATGLLCLTASVITPYGAQPLLYPLRLFAEVKLIHKISEWRPVPFGPEYFIFWGLVALTVLAMAWSAAMCISRGELRGRAGQFWVDAVLMAGFGFLAIRSLRNVAWFVLLAAPVVGSHIALARQGQDAAEQDQEEAATRARVYSLAVYALAAVLILQHTAGGRFGLGTASHRFPTVACDALEEDPLDVRFYSVYEWGGYLIWRWWPHKKVFIDGRCLVYGDEGIREAGVVARGEEGWEQILRRHGVQAVLISYRRRESSHFYRSPEWRVTYWDDDAFIALHRSLWEEDDAEDDTSVLPVPTLTVEPIEDTSP